LQHWVQVRVRHPGELVDDVRIPAAVLCWCRFELTQDNALGAGISHRIIQVSWINDVQHTSSRAA